jgi:hypothetical protein
MFSGSHIKGMSPVLSPPLRRQEYSSLVTFGVLKQILQK